jgi:rhamnogalacturonyl hydrolase YesR
MQNWNDIQARGLWKSISSLSQWLDQNGFGGYDPYDIKGTPLFLRLQQESSSRRPVLKGVRRLLFALETFFPKIMRRIFGVKKQTNAKAMGLFAKGYLNLYQATGEKIFQEKAISCLQWLMEHPSPGYDGLCWGYPFDWQSKVFIPRGTPSAVVSSAVGDGFWKAYRLFDDPKYLDACQQICRFFINHLNVDEIDNDSLCFSYTPLDDFHVHNANLFVAEFLLRVGKQVNNDDYMRLGLNAANYALSEQNDDGSIFYWGRIQDHYSPRHLDHYHSGFEVRSLYSIWKITGEDKFYRAFKKYYDFYLSNFFENKTIPKLTPEYKYPINIHSCAEAILCNSILVNEFPECEEYLKNVLIWTIENMQDKQGWFYYMIRNFNGIEWKAKIPYIRWGQAWMLRGLSEAYYQWACRGNN